MTNPTVQPVRVQAGESHASAPPTASPLLIEEMRSHALRDREAWGQSTFGSLTRRAEQATATVSHGLWELRRRAKAGKELGQAELWLLENGRRIKAAAKDLSQTFRTSQANRATSKSLELRCADASRSFFHAVSFTFDKQTFDAYFQAAQQEDPWPIHEMWALKPAMQLVLVERLADLAESLSDDQLEQAPVAWEEVRNCISSLYDLDQTDWPDRVEALSETERVLRKDPAGAYAGMDFDTRDRYRSTIANLALRSKCSEEAIAEKAVALAAEAKANPLPDPRATQRRSHVGYYLIDGGRGTLEKEVAYRHTLGGRLKRLALKNPSWYYLGLIELTAIAVILLVVSGGGNLEPLWLTALLLLLPATEAAVGIVNRLTAALFSPRVMPKMDFSEGIPAECSTLVIVPTLLLSEEQVHGMVDQLEIRYLANRQPNLAFGLVTDTPDSPQQFDEKDRLAQICAERIQALNDRYLADGQGSFYLFHRTRLYNPSEQVWMGWERKRGKLLELNQFLLGNSDPFPVKVGDMGWVRKVRYIITLDSDTQLPKDSAHRLIGTLAHPLNRPVVDPETNIVKEGYALVQPRIGISVHSATRSRLAAVFSGETGFDIYTRAVSETYQDLFGEGSFSGKGAYELETFEKVLGRRFPTNTLLSHDLIEGAHARCGLASDIELIDDYPSHVSAYSRRKHRWVRGDWQIMRWILPRVPDAEWRLTANPLSTISQWKIFDNLRRSLFDVSIFVLLLCGWLFLPGGPLFWTVAVLLLLVLPGYFELALGVFEMPFATARRALWRSKSEAFVASQLHVFFFLSFLPHQTLVMLDAVTRTMRRMFLTRQKLLEWETAAEAETGARKRRTPVDRYLDASVWLPASIGALLALANPQALMVAGPVLLMWGLLKPMCAWLDGPPAGLRRSTSKHDAGFLRDAALRTWRFFSEHSGAEEHWLVPDSVQESPVLTAHRLSPTNLGLLLNARLAALEMGYLTLSEAIRDIGATIATVQRLPRHQGHLFNWYDTQTLNPLPPLFISTVDNGNLAGCLWTLKQGLLEFTKRSPVELNVWLGLEDHIRLLEENAAAEKVRDPDLRQVRLLRMLAAGWRSYPESRIPSLLKVIRILDRLQGGLAAASPDAVETLYWTHAAAERARAIRRSVVIAMPWLLPEFQAELRASGLELPTGFSELPLNGISGFVESLAAIATSRGTSREVVESLRACRASVTVLVEEATRLAAEADRFVREMDFRLLFNERRKMLSVGYEVEAGKLARSCYDLLASEARMAAFVAVAKGDIPQESWFRLGRGHVLYRDECVLLSWTGTMFEYLMPLLWMRSYPNTVLDNSALAAVRAQVKTATEEGVPWGVSEASYGSCDEQGCYQYHAFGLPGLALRESRPARECAAWTVAPYASFLALSVDPATAVANLRDMHEQGWSRQYGFYDSIEFEPGSTTGRPVRTWMAHHQGMSMLAVCNLLHRNVFRRWFHAEPSVAAVELLLHEKVPRAMTAEAVEEPIAA